MKFCIDDNDRVHILRGIDMDDNQDWESICEDGEEMSSCCIGDLVVVTNTRGTDPHGQTQTMNG